jgi:hypothetical protein
MVAGDVVIAISNSFNLIAGKIANALSHQRTDLKVKKLVEVLS